MKFQSNIIYVLLLNIAFISCSSSDDNSNPDPNPDPVPVYEQYGEPFANMPKSTDAVIYQVNIRAFSNEGTLKGVENRLDSIKKLGANVIYLMPIYPVGQIKKSGKLGSPYSVKDYKAVNPDFGSLADLRSLVNESHKRNMAVILDWVANHTSWDNKWITEHSDWYQKDASGNIIIPPGTNYNDVAQLNFSNAEMKKGMIDAMSYWVYTANIDGFRCDYADFVPSAFWSQAISTVRKIKNQNILMMAEGSRADNFASGFDYNFGFGFYDSLKKVIANGQSASNLQTQNTKEYSNSGSGRVVRYVTNHDVNLSDGIPQDVFVSKKGSLAAFVVALSMNSIPMIYNGQEVGYAKRLDYFDRTPIDWSSTDFEMLKEYKKLIAFRNSSEALKKGKLTGYSNSDVSAFIMQSDTEKILVVVNLRNQAVTYGAATGIADSTWKNVLTGESLAITNEIKLGAYQYLLLKK
jgi:glycosidase